MSGTHRDEYFFTTDESLSPEAIIAMYGARWNIETTFQEMRSHLGLETTRGWSRQTVLRISPCLFLLYTLTVLFYDMLPAQDRAQPLIAWQGKRTLAFSDMMTQVRGYLWMACFFSQVPGGEGLTKLPPRVRRLLTYGLCQPA